MKRMIGVMSLAVLMCALLLPGLAYGQIKLQKSRFTEQGKVHFGGGISWQSMTEEAVSPNSGKGDTVSTFAFQPFVAYFVIPGLEVGGIINYTSSTISPQEGSKSSSSMFGLGPLVSYYHKVHPMAYAYGRGYLTYLLSVDIDGMNDADIGGYQYALGVGVAIPVGHMVGGVLRIGLDYRTDVMTMKAGGVTYETKDSGPVLATSLSLYF